VDLDELHAHAGGTLGAGGRRLALPHDATDTGDHALVAGEPDLELEEGARRGGRRRLDEDAALRGVVRVVLDELVDRRALVPDVEADDLCAFVLARVLAHLSPTTILPGTARKRPSTRGP